MQIIFNNNMSIGTKFETVDNQSSQISMIKYEAPVDITQKLQSYEKAKLIQRPNQSKPSSQDVLNIILPPREWKNTNQEYFMQYVSHQKPQRADVQNVQKLLQSSLLKMQARTDSMCPIRQMLFSQTFDQIIRQVTINCPQRGLMLLRVRDQRKMTIAAYETIYQDAKSFGMRKQFESQEGMSEIEGELKGLQNKAAELQRKRINLLSKKASMQQKYRERNAVEAEKRQYQLSALIKQNNFLQKFLSTKKKVEEPPSENKQEQEVN